MPDPSSPRLRLFVALDLPEPIRHQLAVVQVQLPSARWVAPAQLHLTMRFLGSVAGSDVASLQQRLAAVQPPPVMSLRLNGTGVFPPNPGRRSPARVLWAGVQPAAPVAELKRAIDSSLGPDPEGVGREFSPHVTLARFKEPPGPELPLYLERHAALVSEPFSVTAFHLYESRTLPEGPIYVRLQSYPLPSANDRAAGQAPPSDRA